jgi:hypothetical protein
LSPRIEDIARAAEIMKVQIAAAKLIDLPVAPANMGALVGFCDTVHDEVGREVDTVSLHRTACVRQDIQAGFVGPDDSHLMQDLKRCLMHRFDIFVG